MLGVFIASLLILLNAIMAYIAYKRPFNGEDGQITKYGKRFGWLVAVSIICAIIAGGDAYFSKKESDKKQNDFSDTLNAVSANVTSLRHNIDAIGYKIDKSTGKLVPKIANRKQNVVISPVIKGEDLGFMDEIPKGKIDDINKVYTISHIPIQGTFQFFYNGVKQSMPDDFIIKDTVITLKFSPSKTSNNDHINVTYRYLKN